MKNLTTYISESLKSADYNKVIKEIHKLFVHNNVITVKEASDNKVKIDSYGLPIIYLPVNDIGEWRDKLKKNLPYCKVELAFSPYQFHKPVSGFTITFDYYYDIPDETAYSKIIKSRLKVLDTPTKKQIKTFIMDYLAKEHDFSIFFNRMSSDKIQYSRSYLEVSENLMPAVITYIKDKLNLKVTDNSDFNKQATEYTINK